MYDKNRGILFREMRNHPRVPERDEKQFPWLTILLDTYLINDTGIELELANEEQKRGTIAPCRQGCGNCCLRPKIPINELEIMGISWFVSNKLDETKKAIVKDQVFKQNESAKCPFLVEMRCAIYPVRPLACRMFYIFGQPCGENEDVSETRVTAIWTNSRMLGLEVANVLLSFWNITSKKEKNVAFEQGFLYAKSRLMHTLSWGMIFQTP